MKGRFTEDQIIATIREYEARARVGELCRRHEVSSRTLYKWKAKFGGMTVPEARRRPEAPRKTQVLARFKRHFHSQKTRMADIAMAAWIISHQAVHPPSMGIVTPVTARESLDAR